MAANTNALFPLTPNNGVFGVILTTGSNNYDGTNANAALVFTAGTNGSQLRKVTAKASGSGTNTATVLRLFLNNNSTVGTAANNILFAEFTLATTTGSATSQTQVYEFGLNKTIAPGSKIYALLATTVSAGYAISVDGGDF
jgi:hypothetical protein